MARAQRNDILTARGAQARLASLANPAHAARTRSYFKTGPGEYGEGDRFRGIRTPAMRSLAKELAGMPVGEVLRLLRSPFHEDRMLALLLMVRAYRHGDEATRRAVATAYLDSTRYVNNWDLVDSSAGQILGPHFREKPGALRKMARSGNVWERRMAVIAAGSYIREAAPALTLELAERLLNDEHDLIHKASGWMLREVGHRCGADTLRAFLDAHAPRMPRTMLRYAIEHLSKAERARYLTMARAARA